MKIACETPSTGVAANIAQSFAALVPVLKTDRLILRAPRVEDFAVYAETACSDRGAGIGGPMNRADAWWDFVQLASGWMLHGHGGWTIEGRETGETLGFVLIGLEPGDQEPELGYLLGAKAEGRGIAQEAARAVLAFARDTLKCKTLVSYIDAANARSIRVAERLGAQRDGDVTFEGETALVCRHNLTGAH
jgi:RimJ/RimL family protein N-acetyltransferase